MILGFLRMCVWMGVYIYVGEKAHGLEKKSIQYKIFIIWNSHVWDCWVKGFDDIHAVEKGKGEEWGEAN